MSLQTGQYISIAMESSYDMDEYHKVVIRDKITASVSIIVSKDNSTIPVIKRFIEFYCNQKKIISPI